MSFRYLAILPALLFWLSPPVLAQQERIAAIVNDDAVSMSDVEYRLRLALLALSVPDSADVRERLLPDILRDLINERLQLQEAKRLGIEVTDAEIDEAVAGIAEQNNQNVRNFVAQLEGRGIPLVSFRDQLRVQIAWSQVLQRTVRREVEVTEEDIDAALERLQSTADQTEYLLAEIFLPVDNPADDDRVRSLAERLFDQIRGGANFPVVAAQFSQSAGAARGGDLGWVPSDQLSPAVRETLDQMPIGALSPPIRDVTGYRLMALRDRRRPGGEAEMVAMRQLFLPVAQEEDADFAKRTAMAQQMREQIVGCAAMDQAIAQYGTPMSGDSGRIRLDDLPPMVREALDGVPDGRIAEPLMRQDGMLLLMPCERIGGEPQMPNRDQIAGQLSMERMEILQRRYIRDLRAAAFVDIRA